MKLEKKRWIILAASCLINLCIGSLYAWSVFATPLAEHLNQLYGYAGASAFTASSLAIVFTFANSVGPVTMISGGVVNDKFGPRWVVTAGGLLFGLGTFATGFATTVPVLIITYGLGLGLGMGLVYGCTVSNSVKFFPDMKGLIGGIAVATYGLSSVVVPPIANSLIQSFGVQAAFRYFGIAFAVIICVCACFIEKCPDGFMPEGYVPKNASGTGPAIQVEKNWKQMLSDPIFYVMILMLVCGAFSGLMIISQASPMAQTVIGLSSASAAMIVSVLALFNAGGRVLSGLLSDKLGGINTVRLVFVLAIAGLFLLFSSSSFLPFVISVSIIGFCFGSFMGIYPGFTANQFGVKNNSVNYGIMFIGFASAGYFAPTAVGKILTDTGSYNNAFLIAIALSAVGIVLSFIYAKMSKSRQASAK